MVREQAFPVETANSVPALVEFLSEASTGIQTAIPAAPLALPLQNIAPSAWVALRLRGLEAADRAGAAFVGADIGEP